MLPRPAFYAKSDLIRTTWPAQAFEALVEAIERRQADPVLTPSNYSGGVNVGKFAFETAGGAIGGRRQRREPSRIATFVTSCSISRVGDPSRAMRLQTPISRGRTQRTNRSVRGYRAARIKDTPIPIFPIGNGNITARACSDYER